MLWDVFISHASEDKADVVRPLAQCFREAGLRVWVDEMQLKVGDSLRAKIDEGLAQSRYGVVILSPSFFSKPWPQRELDGLFARPNSILPVWHNLGPSDVAKHSLMLAGLVAASTGNGVEEAAHKILEVVGSRVRPERSYTTSIAVSLERIERALVVIESLSLPATWRHLESTTPGYPAEGWLGSDSDTMIEVVYGFMMPLVHYRKVAPSARRNLALLDRRSRVNLALLECAVDALCTETALATMEPPIAYTPRVPDWRLKRQQNPQRYWWQGVSPERFDEAVPFFLRASVEMDENPFVTGEEFSEFYREVYRCSDQGIQQSLGVLINGFHDFRPDRRPVLWRVCICLARIYTAILGNTLFTSSVDPVGSVAKLFRPAYPAEFPFTLSNSPDELFEPYAATVSAVDEYLRIFVVPKVETVLLAAQE